MTEFYSKKQKNINVLESFKHLKKGWDAYGADPVSVDLINVCINLLLNLDENYQPPDVFPTACLSIQFEWETETKYLEIEIVGENEFEYFSYNYNFECEAIGTETDWNLILLRIKEFTKGIQNAN